MKIKIIENSYKSDYENLYREEQSLCDLKREDDIIANLNERIAKLDESSALNDEIFFKDCLIEDLKFQLKNLK